METGNSWGRVVLTDLVPFHVITLLFLPMWPAPVSGSTLDVQGPNICGSSQVICTRPVEREYDGILSAGMEQQGHGHHLLRPAAQTYLL